MANYYAKTRTNYFKVTDEEKLKNIISHTCGGEDDIHLYEETENGKKIFMFWCESSIQGLAKDGEYDDCDYDGFLEALQRILPEGEAIIITEVGSEKLCCLSGDVVVITRYGINSDNLGSRGIKLARELLNDKNWSTKNAY